MLPKNELSEVINTLTRSCEILRHREAKCTAAELRLQTLVRMALREARTQEAEREVHEEIKSQTNSGLVGAGDSQLA